MQTIPSSFDICCFVFAKMNKRILLINKIPQSIIDSFSTCSGERMAENPRINKMLNRLEPIAFPSARPLSPFLVATMEVTSSGREVPIATMVSQNFIGLTIVAMGTSLPELVTSIVAARKNEVDMALGNVIGSNIFNILLVLGVAAAISPVKFLTDNIIDTVVLIAMSLVVLVFAWTSKMIDRREGATMLGMYAVYMAYICIR